MPGRICLVVLAGVFLILAGGVTGEPPEDLKKEGKKGDAMMKALPIEEALVKARCNDKYRMLLRQIKVEKDADPTKDIIEMGMREVDTYAGHAELPKGYWVYVAPYWYIWRDQGPRRVGMRAWGPEQVEGPPNTTGPGDIQTAWASQTTDEQEEWLLCEYAEPVIPSAISVYETYNPGAITKVSVFKLDGTEVEVWKGEDPTQPDAGHGISVIPIKVDFKVNRVKVYLDSPSFPGWNEIDAVGMQDSSGQTQWASTVETSSTYAQQSRSLDLLIETPVVPQAVLMERIQNLEMEVKGLKESLEDMKKMLRSSTNEIKDLLKKKDQ